MSIRFSKTPLCLPSHQAVNMAKNCQYCFSKWDILEKILNISGG